MARASGLMWHDVPNRGLRRPNVRGRARRSATSTLTSAWQGDNAGATAVRPTAAVDQPHWLQAAGRAQGRRLADHRARCSAASSIAAGPDSQPLIVQTNPVPYRPVSLDTTRVAARLARRPNRTRGEVIGETAIAPADWAWAACDAGNPFPGTPDPTQICLKNGFDASRLYQVVFTRGRSVRARHRLRGLARRRRLLQDRAAPTTPARPIRSPALVTHSIARGVSQSGNFLRGWLHLGFNQDEAGRQVHDGLWPIIAGPAHRAELPLGAARRRARALPGRQRRPAMVAAASPIRCAACPAAGILDRCTRDAAPARRSSSTSARPKCGR